MADGNDFAHVLGSVKICGRLEVATGARTGASDRTRCVKFAPFLPSFLPSFLICSSTWLDYTGRRAPRKCGVAEMGYDIMDDCMDV